MRGCNGSLRGEDLTVTDTGQDPLQAKRNLPDAGSVPSNAGKKTGRRRRRRKGAAQKGTGQNAAAPKVQVAAQEEPRQEKSKSRKGRRRKRPNRAERRLRQTQEGRSQQKCARHLIGPHAEHGDASAKEAEISAAPGSSLNGAKGAGTQGRPTDETRGKPRDASGKPAPAKSGRNARRRNGGPSSKPGFVSDTTVKTGAEEASLETVAFLRPRLAVVEGDGALDLTGALTDPPFEDASRNFAGGRGRSPRADARRGQSRDGGRDDSSRQGAGGAPQRSAAIVTGAAPLYAALDLGTNNCRLLVARPEERGFRVVDAYSRIVRLGEGVGASRCLSEAAMERAIDALANCRRKLTERGVHRSRLIATEACRAAENGERFIERVQEETGLALEIVNRETEARLAVAGCATLVDREADGVLLFDIGGGSSEIVWLDLRNRCGARGYALTRFIRSWISLPLGVVTLAERHGGMDVTYEVFEAMVDDVTAHLQKFTLSDELSEAIRRGSVHMLGTSGTVTTLAGVYLGLKRYDRRRVDGAWLADADVSAMISKLREMPYEERVGNPCIGADRADLVLAGCAILEAIRRRWSCSRLRVADRGLREGILTELMAADGVWHKGPSRNRSHRQKGDR